MGEAARLSEEAGLGFKVSAVTTAKNLLSAPHVANLKVPAKKNLIAHLMWLKDKHTKGAVKKLMWTDTRDMTVDGRTKGSIKGDALRVLMDGNMSVTNKHERLKDL